MLLGHHGKRLGNRDVEFGNSCGHMFRTDGFVDGVEKGVSPTQATVLHMRISSGAILTVPGGDCTFRAVVESS